MTSKPLLSICIPSYNRSEKVSNMVRQILTCQPTVQVVVLDNCSEKYHIDLFSEIALPNYKFVKREKNIGGNANVADAYTYSDGKYSLLCLDKDYINVDYLGEFLEFLASHPDLTYGQCSLNETQVGASKFYPQGFQSLMAWGYDCNHPTGFFVDNEKLRKTGIIDRILSANNNFAFNTDLIKAHLMMQGEGCYYNVPLMSTETLTETAKERSHTYSGDNIWFFPKNIITRAQLFIVDAVTLNLPTKELTQLINRIYSTNQSCVSWGFNEFMLNESICAHHGINARKVSFCETWRNLMNFKHSFLRFDMPISTVTKHKIAYFNLLKSIVRKLLIK